jgi:hypothetical protein
VPFTQIASAFQVRARQLLGEQLALDLHQLAVQSRLEVREGLPGHPFPHTRILQQEANLGQ